MKKITKALLITAAVAALGWSALATAYTHTVSEALATLRRESRSDVNYLRYRIRELESELSAELREALHSLNPTEDTVGTDAPQEGTAQEPAESEGTVPETESESHTSEAVTIPVHQSPETRPAVTEGAEDTAPPVSPYLLAEYHGIIGVFDAAGELLSTVNVFVMTLPKADREALSVGIPAATWQEAEELIEAYS